MALDGILLHYLKDEIASFAVGSRVDKIHQPTKDEVVLTLRSREGTKKLLLSCRADSPRIHFTKASFENPQKPPMFTMLLRKHLQGARVVSIDQDSLERALTIVFDGTDELGDQTRFCLVIEIMSRYSNIILTNKDGVIVDCIKRIGQEQSSVRFIQPGVKYEVPPGQNKLNIFTDDLSEIKRKISQSEKTTAKACQDVLMGVSPILCREIESGLLLEKFKELLLSPTPIVILNDKPIDFTFIPINQYGGIAETKIFDTFSQMLDFFFYERVRLARIKSRSADLFKMLSTLQERALRKADNRKRELIECEDKDILRIYADLITTNQYILEKGSLYYDLENYYDNNKIVRIPVDVTLSPSDNAQKYYKEYRKKQIAQQKLAGFIKEAKDEAVYLETVLDTLSRAETEAELTAIKEELSAQGYLRRRNVQSKKQKPLAPMEYESSDGFKILIGRNNVMNDRLTLKIAKANDLWFHVKDTAGCHVIVCSDGKSIGETAIQEAAVLAAYNSKAGASSNVPVDYTFARYVKKPAGAKPGRVIYTDFKTVYVTPSVDEIERLKKID